MLKLDGIEFVRRYLRHVLPPKMHSVRHYGFSHPAAKKNRERVRFLTGMTLRVGPEPQPGAGKPPAPGWLCPCCGCAMRFVARHPRSFHWGPSPRPPPNAS